MRRFLSCCTEDTTDPKCATSNKDPVTEKSYVPFIAQTCDDDTGQSTACSDAKDSPNDPGKTLPKTSDCEQLKLGIYNFTRDATSAQRVDFYPLDGKPKQPKVIDIVQLMYAELCDSSIGYNRGTDQCPGLMKGSTWLFGDKTDTQMTDFKGEIR
eukprot:SAG11_NODE_3084_length_2706_cov_4.251630_3_plen_155_part_00